MRILDCLKHCRSLVRSFAMFETERKYREESKQRPELSDDEFIQQFYPDGVKREIPLRIRKILSKQLKLNKLEPPDCPADILQDIDLYVIVREVADDFDVSVTEEEVASLDGSIDSIVRLVDQKVTSRRF
jgi:hypothetical protein